MRVWRSYERVLARLILTYQSQVHGLAIVLTLVINAIMLATWEAPADPADKVPITPPWYMDTLYVLGALHVAVSALLLVIHLENSPYLFSPRARAVRRDKFLAAVRAAQIDFDKGDGRKYPLALYVRVARIFLHQFHLWQHLYYVAFLVFSVLGVVYDGYFFAFHLLHVIDMSAVLKDVLKSVTRNGSTLLYLFGLGLIVIYIFSVAVRLLPRRL